MNIGFRGTLFFNASQAKQSVVNVPFISSTTNRYLHMHPDEAKYRCYTGEVLSHTRVA